MNFTEWLLLNEADKITVEPNLEVPVEYSGGDVSKIADEKEIKKIARDGLTAYYQRTDPKGWKFLKSRYNFHVADVKTHSFDGLTLDIKIAPIAPKGGKEETSDDEYYKKYYGGKTGVVSYKTPKDAIEEIPNDPALGYRGMAWEEWQSIRKTGKIQSRGMYNIGQEGFTLFGMKPETALSYAHGFAPLQYQVGHRKPGVVIAVPRKFLLTHKEDPENVPEGELGLKGPLGKEHIVNAWMLNMTKSKNQGYMDLIFKWIPGWDQNNYKDPRTGVFVPDFKNPRIGSANLSGGVQYSIRQML
ncbi:MAG: hypothetical protein ACW987_00585 [Candidatus Thorarchaeota archaeon]|jgi:hypothetical protein